MISTQCRKLTHDSVRFYDVGGWGGGGGTVQDKTVGDQRRVVV